MRKYVFGFLNFMVLAAFSAYGVSFLPSCGGGGGGGQTCTVGSDTGCQSGQVCQAVQGGQNGCFSPVTLTGTVTDPVTGQPIQGVRVVALDANGSAASDVAVTDASGNYSLSVLSTRDVNGTPIDAVTLRADAFGYQTYPLVTPPFAIDLSQATQSNGSFTLNSNLTAIHLNKVQGGAGTASITGNLSLPTDHTSVLVVAELSGGGKCPALPNSDCSSFAAKTAGSTTEGSGDFAIYNLPAGNYVVKGYVNGTEYNSVNVTVGSGPVTASPTIKGPASATLTAKVNIVNPGQGQATSVILVVESTLNQINSTLVSQLPVLIRGTMPPGLRAADVTGDFTISGIPDGKYVILAAFENDHLVRDPDLCIAGTDILHITVSNGQVTNPPANPFKVTGSLDVLAPTQNQLVGANPNLSWVDDSSESNYLIMVFDNFGTTKWENMIGGSSGSNPVVPYGGLALTSGQFYQFRVLSLSPTSPSCKNQTGSDFTGISQTEDLLGVFQVQ